MSEKWKNVKTMPEDKRVLVQAIRTKDQEEHFEIVAMKRKNQATRNYQYYVMGCGSDLQQLDICIPLKWKNI